MQDYVAGGIVGYIVGWISALLAIASVERVDLAVRHAVRRRARARALHCDDTPLAQRRGPLARRLALLVGRGARLRGGARARADVPAVRPLWDRDGGVGPEPWWRQDAHGEQRQAFIDSLQRRGVSIDELQLEKR
jgi:hypothetical protein